MADDSSLQTLTRALGNVCPLAHLEQVKNGDYWEVLASWTDGPTGWDVLAGLASELDLDEEPDAADGVLELDIDGTIVVLELGRTLSDGTLLDLLAGNDSHICDDCQHEADWAMPADVDPVRHALWTELVATAAVRPDAGRVEALHDIAVKESARIEALAVALAKQAA